MTEETLRSALDAQAFNAAMEAVLKAHRHYLACMADPAAARRSRRALYEALKDYRRKETALYRRGAGLLQVTEDNGLEQI